MNDQSRTDALPTLSDAAVLRIENAVFDEIAGERQPVNTAGARARQRRRRWLTGVGVAAAFVVGVLVTPPILGAVGGGSTTSASDAGSLPSVAVPEAGVGAPNRSAELAPEQSAAADSSSSTQVGAESATGDREIIATASATVEVEDIAGATVEIRALAEDNGGYVESTEIGRSLATDDESVPAPTGASSGWISIRVPSADLPTVITALGDTGEVVSSSTSQQDVTSVAIDLRARVDATQASVTRLTELMAQSGSVAELIEAEVALTERQAQLESYEQQLAALEDQVAMSSLQVQLTLAASTTTADPAGFGDGLLAGWNGLIVSLNAVVIALGFILPWAAIAGVIVLVVWFIRRTIRRRRA